MSAVLNTWGVVFATVTLTADRPGLRPAGNASFGRMRLATEPVGVFDLMLTNLVPGSAVLVQASDGTPLYSGVASGPVLSVSLDVYAAGSPLNELRIKVRKASGSPFYQPFETQAAAFSGAQSIFVSQIPDE